MRTVLPHPHENEPCIEFTGMDWGGFHVLLRLWSIYRNRVFILHCWQAIPRADWSKCDINLKVLPDKCRIELFLSIYWKLSSNSIPTCWQQSSWMKAALRGKLLPMCLGRRAMCSYVCTRKGWKKKRGNLIGFLCGNPGL